MTQVNQVRLEPGSASGYLHEQLRVGRIRYAPRAIAITLATPATVKLVKRSDSAWFSSYTILPMAGGGSLTPSLLASMTGPMIPATPVAALGTASSNLLSDGFTNKALLPLFEAASGDELLLPVGGSFQQVFAALQCSPSTEPGDAVGASGSENLQVSFFVYSNGSYVAATVPAGSYRLSLPVFIQERHRSGVEIEGGGLMADPGDPGAAIAVDEIRFQCTTLVPAGTAININTGAVSSGGLVRTNPSGTPFDLTPYANQAEFEADPDIYFWVAGQEALKKAVASLPAATAETAVEWLSGTTFRASIDLWPGAWIVVKAPRMDTPPVISSNTGILGPAPLRSFSLGTKIGIGGSTQFNGTIVKNGNSGRFSFAASSQSYLSPTETGILVTGTANATVQAIMEISTAELSEVTEVRVTSSNLQGYGDPYAVLGFDFASGGNLATLVNLETLELSGNPSVQAIRTTGLPASIQNLLLQGNGLNGGATIGSTYSTDWSGLAGLSNLAILNLSSNQLPVGALNNLLSVLNNSGSSVTNCAVNLAGNPGSASVNLGNYPNLAGKSITVQLS